VISRFVEERWFITTDEQRGHYLRLLGNALEKSDWSCLAYALMSSHIHIAMVAGSKPAESWSRAVNGPFARWFNEMQERIGPMFAGRADMTIERTQRVAHLIAYIHNNPVRAGVVGRARDSSWTSHRAYIGGDRPAWLDVDRGLALSGLVTDELDGWVHEQRNIRRKDLSLEQIDREAKRFGRITLGTPRVEPTEVPLLGRRHTFIRPNPGRIGEIVIETLGLEEGELQNRWRGSLGTIARAVLVQVGQRFGVSLTSSGEAAGISPTAASRLARAKLDKRGEAALEIVSDRVRREIESVLKNGKASPINRAESQETEG
jgi:hypothetical protein